MSYEFDVMGWEDWNGNVHTGPPLDSDLPDVMGTFSRFYDPDTGDEHYHWVYIDPPEFEDWDDWYDLIAGIMDDHGFAMA